MQGYFPGRRKVTSSATNKDGLAIECAVFEEWKNTNQGIQAFCGQPVKASVKRSAGLSQKDTDTLKAVIESSIGQEKIAHIKSSIEASISTEISWSILNQDEIEWTVNPPKCGFRTETVYQYVRTHEFTWQAVVRRGIFKRIWRAIRDNTKPEFIPQKSVIEERTHNFAFVPEIVENDPRCGCRAETNDVPRGTVLAKLGALIMQLPYWRGDDAIFVDLGNGRDRFFGAEVTRFPHMVEVKADRLPAHLLALAEVSEQLSYRIEIMALNKRSVDNESDYIRTWLSRPDLENAKALLSRVANMLNLR